MYQVCIFARVCVQICLCVSVIYIYIYIYICYQQPIKVSKIEKRKHLSIYFIQTSDLVT